MRFKLVVGWLILAVLVGGFACAGSRKGQEVEVAEDPRLPLRMDAYDAGSLVSQEIRSEASRGWWALPRFPINNWDIEAFWRGDPGPGNFKECTGNIWRVKAYHLDGSYLGEWEVPDCEFAVSSDVKPKDRAAGDVLNGKINMVLPNSSTKKQLVGIAQRHIANLPEAEAKRRFLDDVWRMIHSFYPVDWYVSYDDRYWYLRPLISPQFGDPTQKVTIVIDTGSNRVFDTWGP